MKGKEHKSVRREGEESRDSNSSHNQEDHVPSFSPKKQFSRRKKEEKTNNIKDKRKDKHKYSDSDSEPNKKRNKHKSRNKRDKNNKHHCDYREPNHRFKALKNVKRNCKKKEIR